MTEPAQEAKALYDQLLELPEHLVGEIIQGRVHTHPRPTGPHAIAESSLGHELIGPFQKGKGGPGGWWIIIEPEVHFVRDVEVTVPDVAGWRKEHMPRVPRGHRFEVVPDWVCEILSPTTAKLDRTEKLPLYAQYGISHAWIIDPVARILEVFELNDSQWTVGGVYKDEDVVSAAPFEDVRIELRDLWADAA